MLRKPVFVAVVLALSLVLPSLAGAQVSTSPAGAGCPPETQSDATLDAIFGEAPKTVALPEEAQDPVPMACPWTYFQCIRCSGTKIKLCEYWGCSGTLKGCGPCTTACPI